MSEERKFNVIDSNDEVIKQVTGKCPKEAANHMYYEATYGDKVIGKFAANDSRKAAMKAMTKLYKQKDIPNGEHIMVKNIGTGLQYEYECMRTKLAEPMKVKIGDKEIEYNYNNRVKKI